MALSDPHMSVADYFELEQRSGQRYEFIDGVVYMLAGGTLNHATISANLVQEIGHALKRTPCGVCISDAKVRLSDSRYVYPDFSVSYDERDRGKGDSLRYPRVVVEVLSPSTEAYDRGKKFEYYRECLSIQEYMLVDAERPAVDLFRRASANLWTFHAFREGDQVVLASLDVEITLAGIYECTLL